jgi:glutathionyl-hydroquinone reductase
VLNIFRFHRKAFPLKNGNDQPQSAMNCHCPDFFDAVYYSDFKCNLRRIADYPNLSNYRRDIYQVPGIVDTVNMDHIKRHYYMSMTAINPTSIVPLGPEPDFAAPHDRGVLS